MSSDHHQHDVSCQCVANSGIGSSPFAETFEQMAFSKSMSGFLIRGASPAQIAAYVREHAQRLLKTTTAKSVLTMAEITALLVNARDPSTGYTAIHHATRPQQTDRLRHCELLISLGADLTLSTPAMGWTALHRVVAGATEASVDEDVKLVHLLVNTLSKRDGDDSQRCCCVKDAQGNTPVMLARKLTFHGSDALLAALNEAS